MQQDSRVFEMMALAQDLGMEKLKIECEDHVISTMKGRPFMHNLLLLHSIICLFPSYVEAFEVN